MYANCTLNYLYPFINNREDTDNPERNVHMAATSATADEITLRWGIKKQQSMSQFIFDIKLMVEDQSLHYKDIFDNFKLDVSSKEFEPHIEVIAHYFLVGAMYHNYEADQAFEWAKTKTRHLCQKHPSLGRTAEEVVVSPRAVIVQARSELIEEVWQREYHPAKQANPVKDIAFKLWSTNKNMTKVELVRLIAKEAKITEANARYYIDRVFTPKKNGSGGK